MILARFCQKPKVAAAVVYEPLTLEIFVKKDRWVQFLPGVSLPSCYFSGWSPTGDMVVKLLYNQWKCIILLLSSMNISKQSTL